MEDKFEGVYQQLLERGVRLPRLKPDRLNEEMQSCKFSRDEMLDLGQRIAKSTSEKARLESDKSQVVKQFAAQIAARDAEIGDPSQKLSSGYEWRKVECATYFDQPRKGMATTFRLDTGEEIACRRMTYDELQLTLNMEVEPKEPEPQNVPVTEEAAAEVLAAQEAAEQQAAEEAEAVDAAEQAESIEEPGDVEPIRKLSMSKRGVQVAVDIYDNGPGLFKVDAIVGPDKALEYLPGIVEAETVEQAIVRVCEKIQARAREKADAGESKTAWSQIFSWARETAEAK